MTNVDYAAVNNFIAWVLEIIEKIRALIAKLNISLPSKKA